MANFGRFVPPLPQAPPRRSDRLQPETKPGTRQGSALCAMRRGCKLPTAPQVASYPSADKISPDRHQQTDYGPHRLVPVIRQRFAQLRPQRIEVTAILFKNWKGMLHACNVVAPKRCGNGE